MKAREYDVAVVGLGGMGSAIAAHAASRSARVIGLEQFERGHDLGASSGRTRVIRKAYFENPAYVPMLVRAYELWRELERETGADILRVTGLLMAGRAESEVLTGTREAARLHGLTLDELTHDALRARFPMARFHEGEIALFEPDGGFIRPEAAIEAHLTLAAARGATLRFGTAVRGWDGRADGVTITIDGGETIAARKIVLSVGPWFADAAASLGVRLRIQRNVQVWFQPQRAGFALGELPVFMVDRDGQPLLYGFPDMGDGVKAAFHGFGETTTPQTLRRDADEAEIQGVLNALDAWLPGAAGPARATKPCMYSLTPDGDFVVGARPETPNVILAGGFSGHGFKFCSVIGEIVADLIERDRSNLDIAFLSPQRFAANRTP